MNALYSQPPTPAPAPHLGSVPPPSEDDEDIDFAGIFGTLLSGWKVVAAVAAAAVLVGGLYAFLATPVYSSNVLLQVEDKPGGIAGLDTLTDMFTGETPTEAEIEIVRSRSLLGKVVERLGLDLQVEPKRFPLIGGFVARRWSGIGDETGVREAPLGLDSFAWGGERLEVSRLVVPTWLEGEWLTLTAGEEGRYTVEGPEGELLVEGRVGEATDGGARPDASDSGSAPEGTVGLFVSELRARPGTELRIRYWHPTEVIQWLQEELTIYERGRKTGILTVALSHPDRAHLATVLDTLADEYVRQNVERRSAEAGQTLAFLEEQLPALKARLETAELALNEYRSRVGQVDLTLEAKASLDQAVEIERQLAELDVRRAELERRFTPDHPRLAVLGRQMAELQRTRGEIERSFKQLPETQLASARLLRDVEVANTLYLTLLNQAQQLKVVKSGTIGNVRVLDRALLARRPSSPNKPLTVVIALGIGALLGMGLVFGRHALTKGLDDPDDVSRVLGLPVYASVPHSERPVDEVRRAQRTARRTGIGKGSPPETPLTVLAQLDPQDISIESLRSLRTSLQFARLEVGNNIVTITGPAPDIGKSFISVNLAHVLAQAGQRVVLIDADMRRGELHRAFGGARPGAGLAELIQGTSEAPEVDALAAVLQRGGKGEPDFIARGEAPPNPSELLMSERFAERLRGLSERYDWVLVDTPPILAVTDAAIVGRLSGVNLMVLRSGRHPARELTEAREAMTQGGAALRAVVLNDVRATHGQAGFGYRYAYRGA